MIKIKAILLIAVLASPYTFGANEFIAPALVPIPGGSFLMGNDQEIEVKVKHWPQHKVSVKPFLLSKYEVTVKEFKAYY